MKKLFLSAVRMLSGLLLGILVLKAVFRSNTTLLPHGEDPARSSPSPLLRRWQRFG